jgi:hypothetical protein
MDYRENKTNGRKDIKKKRDSTPKRSLREILQQAAGSSGVPERNPVATGEPAAVSKTKGRKEPVVRNLPEVEPRTSSSGTGGINTPAQGAGSAGTPVAEAYRGSLVPSMGEVRLVKKAFSGCARCKLKKAKARTAVARTGGIPQTGTTGMTGQVENLTETPKRRRSGGLHGGADWYEGCSL